MQKLILDRLGTMVDSAAASVGVYHKVVPQQSQFPAITFRQISFTSNICKGGINTQDTARWQIDIFHKKDTEAEFLFNDIRTKLESWNGVFESERYNFTTLENRTDSFDEVFQLERISVDFIIRKTQ